MVIAKKYKKLFQPISSAMCVGESYYPHIAGKAFQEDKPGFFIMGGGLLADLEWPSKNRKWKIQGKALPRLSEEGFLGGTH